MFRITFGQMWRYKAQIFLNLYDFQDACHQFLHAIVNLTMCACVELDIRRRAPICTIEVLPGITLRRCLLKFGSSVEPVVSTREVTSKANSKCLECENVIQTEMRERSLSRNKEVDQGGWEQAP